MQIAKNGLGTSRPNPAVGAVIVCQDKIIGEGFTSEYGGNHAEVNAINSVKNKSLLQKATLYVSLEPCAHFGKTPPCADLIIKHKLKTVVIGCVDSNRLVAGKGIERLKNSGIHVIISVLEEECKKHHRRFFTVQDKKRPFIILKWAVTKEGFIAPISKKEVQPVFISNPYSQQLVHKLRSKEHAILVGTNTVLEDNPKLNVRSWFGENPVRILLDKTLRIPESSSILDGSVKTIVITESNDSPFKYRRELLFETIDFQKNIASQICSVLQKHNLQSVIIEGGAQTLQTFIDADLWDEAFVFVGENTFEKGIKGPVFNKAPFKIENIQTDVLKSYRND